MHTRARQLTRRRIRTAAQSAPFLALVAAATILAYGVLRGLFSSNATGFVIVPFLVILGSVVETVYSCRTKPGRAGCCQKCGYDTRMTPFRCPECGYQWTMHK